MEICWVCKDETTQANGGHDKSAETETEVLCVVPPQSDPVSPRIQITSLAAWKRGALALEYVAPHGRLPISFARFDGSTSPRLVTAADFCGRETVREASRTRQSGRGRSGFVRAGAGDRRFWDWI